MSRELELVLAFEADLLMAAMMVKSLGGRIDGEARYVFVRLPLVPARVKRDLRFLDIGRRRLHSKALVGSQNIKAIRCGLCQL